MNYYTHYKEKYQNLVILLICGVLNNSCTRQDESGRRAFIMMTTDKNVQIRLKESASMNSLYTFYFWTQNDKNYEIFLTSSVRIYKDELRILYREQYIQSGY